LLWLCWKCKGYDSFRSVDGVVWELLEGVVFTFQFYPSCYLLHSITLGLFPSFKRMCLGHIWKHLKFPKWNLKHHSKTWKGMCIDSLAQLGRQGKEKQSSLKINDLPLSHVAHSLVQNHGVPPPSSK
jgi:hypothetical protein